MSPRAATCLWVALVSVWLCQRIAVGLAGHPGMDAALTSDPGITLGSSAAPLSHCGTRSLNHILSNIPGTIPEKCQCQCPWAMSLRNIPR